MRIEEVRKIIAGRTPGWRVAYVTKNSPIVCLTPDLTEPPLESEAEAETIATEMMTPKFASYHIVRAWTQEA